MAGITGKNALSIKKLDVQESKVPAIGFNKIRFAHKASTGATSFSITSLTTPTEMTANGFVQPNGSVLSQLHLGQFRENLILKSSLRGVLQEYLAFTISGANKINLLFSAEEGEIFVGEFDYVARTGNTIVDAQPLVSTGVLAATLTDYNVGTPFQVGLYSGQQIGAVMVFLDNQLQYRNTGNNPPGVGVEGDYYEVHSGSGLGQIIRFNTPDLSNDRGVVVISVGSLVERPIGSQLALIEALAGQIDSMIPTLAALAGVPESTFQSAPNSVDLKTFGDRVSTAETDIDALEAEKQDLIESVTIRDVKASGTNGGDFNSGAYQTRVLNTLENPLSATWVSLSSNQVTLQPGTYELVGSATAFRCNNHKAKWRNITDSSDAFLGSTEYTNAGTDGSSSSMLYGVFTITSAKVFELQHRCATTQAANGFGNAVGFGDNEVYAQLTIRKIR